ASLRTFRRHFLPLREHVSSDLVRITHYVRGNGRCPACEFFDEIEPQMRKRFAGQFDALTKIGSAYCNHQRFRPLSGVGKPLWEFKEFDHRVYCSRIQAKSFLLIVLLSGWIKDKSGRTDKENREIAKALSLYAEFLEERSGGERK